MSMWSVNHDEGTATGPSEEITADGITVSAAAYWSDEDGVCVEVVTHGDLIPAALAVELAQAVQRLAATPAPELSAI
ncbi:hypothetical protein SEA_EESA_47 [Arthrobacter phage Eesa]|nr:hypothetical protein SEA_EESA_47 [Arthrobacter phage Eesa]